MDAVVHLYLPAFCGFLGVCVFFAPRKPIHDPRDDCIDGLGDWPSVPSDLKSAFHFGGDTK